MSNIYIYEPATNGKVVLETSMGDIEIELWSKEAPKACRNFIALCMEGYYDGLIFHRIVADFIIQTGDPTGTGNGGESFYGEPFEDEPHQRLKFSRRGLVGMANNQERNTNTSQFFITLNQTPELQNKHTIFGKVSADGATIFNVVKMGQLETDGSERPLYPPKIKSVKILDNPFDDIVIRITAAERRKQEARRRESAREREEMAGRKKVKKNTKLLSFGEEAGEDEAEAESAKKNMVRPDLAPSNEPDMPSFESIPVPPTSSRSAGQEGSSSKEVSPSSKPSKSSKSKGDDQDDLSAIRQKAIDEEDAPAAKRRREIAALEESLRTSKKKRAASPSSSNGSPPPKNKTSVLQAELASYSRGRGGGKGKGKAKEEDDVLAMLGNFRKKMQSAAPKAAGGDSDGEDKGSDEEGGREIDRDDGWMGHKLVEERDEKAAEQTRRAETDYEVIDTRGRAQQAKDDSHRNRPPPKKDARSSAQWAGRRG